MTIFVLAALLNLGLMSIPGSGLAVARYQAADVMALANQTQWSFDDLAEGVLPNGAEVLSQPRFGGWAVRPESDAPSPPNALCQTGMAEYPSIALSADVFSNMVMSTRFKPISGMVDQAAGSRSTMRPTSCSKRSKPAHRATLLRTFAAPSCSSSCAA